MTSVASLLLMTLPGCGSRHLPLTSEERAPLLEELEQFHAYWLARARTAPPTIAFEPVEIEKGSLRAVVTPFRPEDAPWNQWPGDEFRLFNNRIGYFFDVRVVDLQGEALVWLPPKTRLTLEPGGDLTPAAAPDDLLEPLLRAAYQEARVESDGDLVERTRAARGFRSAYLPTVPVAALEGCIGFPLKHPDDADMHVIGMELTLAVHSTRGIEEIVWTFD